jgi:hypothetical protein
MPEMEHLMSITALADRGSALKWNPFVPEESQSWANGLAAIWNSRDIASMLSVFSSNCDVEYGDERPFHGLAELKKFLTDRFAGIADYDLAKTVRLVSPPHVCIELDVRWSSKRAPDLLKRTRALEILTLKDGLIVRWELVANPHPRGHA